MGTVTVGGCDMAKIEERVYGIEAWIDVIRAAGEQISESAEEIVGDGNVRSIEISIKGLNPYEIPVIEVTKDYNVMGLAKIIAEKCK